MQKIFVILIFILILIMAVSIVIVNLMHKDAVKSYQALEGYKSKLLPGGLTKPPIGLQELGKTQTGSQAAKEAPITQKEPEYHDLKDIPADEARVLEAKIEKEYAATEEAPVAPVAGEISSASVLPPKRLNTQPTVNKLEELKTKGIIIY